MNLSLFLPFESRGVAQPGRALRSGRRSRWFESSHPDHFLLEEIDNEMLIFVHVFVDGRYSARGEIAEYYLHFSG